LRVDLLGVTRTLHEHVTSALCNEAFHKLRDRERVRKWSLELLVKFWLAIVLHAPRSLRAALAEAKLPGSAFPSISAADSTFFDHSQHWGWRLFREVFRGFLRSAVPKARRGYQKKLRKMLPAFREVWVVDGSGLDRVARRLGVTRNVRQVLIPGSVIAYYDVFRGVLRSLDFYEKLLGGEATRLRESLRQVPKGTLLVLDRGFSSVRLLAELSEHAVDAVVRITRSVVAEEIRVLSRRGKVTDRIVILGTGQKKARRTKVRLIEKLLEDGSVLRIVTTVLDPTRLSAAAALELYRRRWTVERMFQDLKCVLGLRRMYAANTNAVGMQVYASAIVYTALRIAQGEIAHEHRIEPEEISVARLFPRVAITHLRLCMAMQIIERIVEARPELGQGGLDIKAICAADVPLSELLVRKRVGARRRPAYSAARAHVTLLQNHERNPAPRGPP
jgi:hypothetical protein